MIMFYIVKLIKLKYAGSGLIEIRRHLVVVLYTNAYKADITYLWSNCRETTELSTSNMAALQFSKLNYY